jgi:hypothetical protein
LLLRVKVIMMTDLGDHVADLADHDHPIRAITIRRYMHYAGSLILAARNNPRGVPALESRDISRPDFSLPEIPPAERIPSRTQERAVLECTVELLLEHGLAAHQK